MRAFFIPRSIDPVIGALRRHLCRINNGVRYCIPGNRRDNRRVDSRCIVAGRFSAASAFAAPLISGFLLFQTWRCFPSALSSRLRKTIAESACIIDQCQRYRFQRASNSYIAAV
jgi:hypothetical protein